MMQCISSRDKILGVSVNICGYSLDLPGLKVDTTIRGIGEDLIREVRVYAGLSRLFSANVPFDFLFGVCTLFAVI